MFVLLVVKATVGISLLTFWVRLSPPYIHKINENSIQCASLQNVFSDSDYGINANGLRYINHSATISRGCKQCKEIYHPTSSEDRVHTATGKFTGHYIHIFTGKNSGVGTFMLMKFSRTTQ